MFKKIALAGIFAVASIVSFKPATVNAAKLSTPSLDAPVVRGLPACGGSSNCR